MTVLIQAAVFLGALVLPAVLFGLSGLFAEMLSDPDSPMSRVFWFTAAALLVSLLIERDWRAGVKSLVWGRNLGVLLFALGCAVSGIVDYSFAAWPALTLLLASLAVLRWAGGRQGTVAEAAESVLGTTVIGTNVVLAILLVLTVATLKSPMVGFFEAQFIQHYSAVRNWLEPPVWTLIVVLAVLWLLQRSYPQAEWLQKFRQVKGTAGKIAWVLWLVALMVFTGAEGVEGHGARRVARLSWKYSEEVKRLSSAEAKPAAYKKVAEEFAKSNQSERKALHDFAVTLAKAADCEGGPPDLHRGFCRNRMSPDEYWKEVIDRVARAVAGQNVRLYGRPPSMHSSVQVPRELQRLATNAEEDRVQRHLIDEKAAEADAAEASGSTFGSQALSAVLEAIPETDGLVKILTSFGKELLGDYARKGIEYLSSQFQKELWFPTYWKDAFDPQTGSSPLIAEAAKDLEKPTKLARIIERIVGGRDRMRVDLVR